MNAFLASGVAGTGDGFSTVIVVAGAAACSATSTASSGTSN